ncbi:MAG: thiolase family protein [Acidobacteria bacterium]|nr:thiolase family protein [Acidobacteriota bacterium]
MFRNPIKDKIAFVGVGSTGFFRDANARTRNDMAIEASIKAIRDAGLGQADIDGVVGTAPAAREIVEALGLPKVTHFSNQPMPLVFGVVDAMNAVFSGAAETVLMYHALYRAPAISRSAANDPFRRGLGFGGSPAPAPTRHDPEVLGAEGYAAWMSRYFHEFNAPREVLGMIAVNERSGAVKNPLAAMREPITMDDYLSARMVREPLCLLDMDVPVDGADAFVITTAERAKDMPHKPVLIHAATNGITARNKEENLDGLRHHGQHVVLEALRAKSDIWIPDIDVYFPYDGFTPITLQWIENTGWCKPGEGYDFLKDNWDEANQRIMIDGRIPMNTHGGNHSEGGTQGSGHIREAITQLRGDAGERQVAGAKNAFLTPGGMFFNAQGLVLRTD